MHLLHLRARWYASETGTFLSVDPVESEPPYQYVRGRVVNFADPSGKFPPCDQDKPWQICSTQTSPGTLSYVGSITPPREDGIVFGLSGSGHFLTGSPALSLFLTPQGVQFNECWLPTTGGTGGGELVFDFVHQERGLFTYSGNTFSPLTILGANVTAYVGKTQGFAHPENWYNYIDGVGLYSGGFQSTAVSVGTPGLGWGFGATTINAQPLNKEKMVDPTGIFATYYGVSGGYSVALPINFEVAVTDYTLLQRERYLLGEVEPGDEMGIANLKRDFSHRQTVAAKMWNEIDLLVKMTPIFSAIAQPVLSQAQRDLLDFAKTPLLEMPVVLK